MKSSRKDLQIISELPVVLKLREVVQENYLLKEEIRRLNRELERTRAISMKTCILPPRGEQ